MDKLKPIGQLARNYGVKCICYGAPGTAKTPVVATTTPNPVICAIEPGLMSLRDVQHIPAWDCTDPKTGITELESFLDWVFRSNEVKKFDTIVIDSISQMAEIFLKRELGRCKHGMQAYGEMARNVYGLLEGLFFVKDLNVCFFCRPQHSRF